ncbi:helix-turn-helix domain-containing protein [Mycolicibacterium brisbanense]
MTRPDPIADAVATIIAAVHEAAPQRALLSIPEAIAELRISRSQFYRIRSKGLIRTLKLGHRVLVPRREIERLIAEVLGERMG